MVDEKRLRELKERVVGVLPDYVKGLPDDMQSAYIEHEALRLYLEEVPWRYYQFTDKLGREHTVDVTSPMCGTRILAMGGTEEDKKAVLDAYYSEASPIIGRIRRAKSKIRGVFGDRYNLAVVEMGEEIISMFSRCYMVDDVIREIERKKGYKVSRASVQAFYRDNREAIERGKQQFLLSKKDFYIASESGRLEVLNDLLMRWRAKLEREERTAYSAEIRRILEQARKECKGDQLFLTVDGKIDVNAMVHGQDNITEALQRLPINMIVVGLVAAKAGIDPASMIGQLASSYYKDQNGFNRNFLDGQDIKLPGDIIRNMTWEEIGKKAEGWKDSTRPIEDAIVVEESELPRVEERRSRLLELLEQKPRVSVETEEDRLRKEEEERRARLAEKRREYQRRYNERKRLKKKKGDEGGDSAAK